MHANQSIHIVRYTAGMHLNKPKDDVTVNCWIRRWVPWVVEEAAVPQLVLPPGWRVEETRVGAVKVVQAVLRVLWGVAVNDIQQHHDAHRVGHIYHLLQLLRGAVATTDTHIHIFVLVLKPSPFLGLNLKHTSNSFLDPISESSCQSLEDEWTTDFLTTLNHSISKA